MVFEFDYVPLAIGLIAEYAPGAAQAAADVETLPETPPAKVVASSAVPRLDLEAAIPTWNRDEKTLRNERASPLLRLPAELKLKIWAMAYEDVAVHVTCKEDGRIGHFICDENRNGFYRDEEELEQPPVMDAQYMQCRCSGSLLEPPYTAAPHPEDVKRRRESAPAREGLEGIGGMLLACREIYANARDYLYTHPRFILPTQRLLPRFLTSLHPSVRPLIRHLTLHTYSDSWRTPSASGFFGGSCDPAGHDEWIAAQEVAATELTYLKDLHLIVHVAGGDSTIWVENCKPVNCVRSLEEHLARSGRVLQVRRRSTASESESENKLEKVDSGYEEFEEPTAMARTKGKGKGKELEVAPLRCWVTAAVESSRRAPGVAGSWVTSEQVKAAQLRTGGGMYGLRERNVAVLRELEDEMPENWGLSWWVSVEERERGAEGAGPMPWLYNHVPY